MGPRTQGPPRSAVLLLTWALAIAAVTVGSLLSPSSPVMVQVSHLGASDKLLHFAAYTLLAFLPVLGFRDRRTGVLAGLSMVLLGILLEAAQNLTPGRAPDLNDQLANTAGVAVGVLIGLCALSVSARNPKSK